MTKAMDNMITVAAEIRSAGIDTSFAYHLIGNSCR